MNNADIQKNISTINKLPRDAWLVPAVATIATHVISNKLGLSEPVTALFSVAATTLSAYGVTHRAKKAFKKIALATTPRDFIKNYFATERTLNTFHMPALASGLVTNIPCYFFELAQESAKDPALVPATTKSAILAGSILVATAWTMPGMLELCKKPFRALIDSETKLPKTIFSNPKP